MSRSMEDANQAITRQDLNEALARAVQAVAAAVQAEIKAVQAEIRAAEGRTNARIEQVETSLMTEFHKWASPAEMCARSHAATLRAIRCRDRIPPRSREETRRKSAAVERAFQTR